MDAHKFEAFVAKCRKERNMTQAELASKIQVTDKAVSRWEWSYVKKKYKLNMLF